VNRNRVVSSFQKKQTGLKRQRTRRVVSVCLSRCNCGVSFESPLALRKKTVSRDCTSIIPKLTFQLKLLDSYRLDTTNSITHKSLQLSRVSH
jgi:hypothetical protein